jgi:hypothetical protein
VERAEQRFKIGDTCHSRAAGWKDINCICRASDFLLPPLTTGSGAVREGKVATAASTVTAVLCGVQSGRGKTRCIVRMGHEVVLGRKTYHGHTACALDSDDGSNSNCFPSSQLYSHAKASESAPRQRQGASERRLQSVFSDAPRGARGWRGSPFEGTCRAPGLRGAKSFRLSHQWMQL